MYTATELHTPYTTHPALARKITPTVINTKPKLMACVIRLSSVPSLEIMQQLAKANPSSEEAQRDVSVSLNELGDVLVTLGDLKSARDHFEQSLKIRQRLAKANTSSAETQRDLIVGYAKLGQLTGERDWWRRALEIAERLNRTGQLPPRDTWMIDDLRQRVGGGEEGVHTPE